jgi:aminomethyltransferase
MMPPPHQFFRSLHPIPDHCGDAEAEYVALGRGCGLLPAPWESLLVVEGEESAGFLQAMLTQDVTGMPPGATRPAALADRKGRWLADLSVHRDGERFLLRLRSDRAARVCEVFEKHRFAERVDWTDAASESRPFLLLGPRARGVLRGLGVDEAQGDRAGGRLHPAAGGYWMQVREVGANDVALFPPAEDAPRLRAQLEAIPDAPREVGAIAFHARRIEAGTPWHGLDGDETRLVSECVPDERVSFTKGCFLGQETIARVHYRGRRRRAERGPPARRFGRGLRAPYGGRGRRHRAASPRRGSPRGRHAGTLAGRGRFRLTDVAHDQQSACQSEDTIRAARTAAPPGQEPRGVAP